MMFHLFYLLWCFFTFTSINSISYGNSFDDIDFTLDDIDSLETPALLIDNILEDDHEDYDLTNIMTLAFSPVTYDIDLYSREEKRQSVDRHNLYRANTTGIFPPGSNMEYLEYNNTIEWSAQEYVKLCIYKHAFAKNDNMSRVQGQNLYTGPSRDNSRAEYLWYMEWIWYYFNNDTCWLPFPPYQCGHMIQMMWHNVSQLGISRRSHCYPKTPWKLLVNTHYIRGRLDESLKGVYWYSYGWHCTNCPSGKLCYLNLCAPKRACKAYNLDCKCRLTCYNCGQLDLKRCRCSCKRGWYWDDCSLVCYDLFQTKYASCFSAPIHLCLENRRFHYGCQKRCKVCRGIYKDTTPEELCCGGKACDPFYVLDEETCECKLKCPSQKCMYPPSTTTPAITTTTTPAITTMTTPAITTTKTPAIITMITITTTAPILPTQNESDESDKVVQNSASSNSLIWIAFLNSLFLSFCFVI